MSRAISTTEANYQNLTQETTSYDMGYGKITLLSVWQQIHIRNRSEATCFDIQKHLIDVSPRIQRLIVHALPYNFHIAYIPGKQIPMANALLRSLKISEDKEEDQISLPILSVNYITINYQQYPEKFVMNKIREETSKDATLQLLTKYITNGWPVD